MPKRTPALFLVDIFIALDRITRYSKNIACESDLWSDEVICDAIMRELEILGEASKMILQANEFKKFVNPDWRVIVDFRNLISHEYFGIDYAEIFKILTIEIPALQDEMVLFAKQVKNIVPLKDAIKSSCQDLLRMKREKSIQYLESIKALIF